MSDNILVTGATGTLGSQVVERLTATGAGVRAAVHTPAKVAAFGDKVDETVVLDLADSGTYGAALEGVKKVFFLSPLSEDMVERDSAFVKAAAAAGVKHVVRQSGMGADPDSSIVLGRLHGAVEEAIRDSGLDWTFLRPNSFMQNFSTYQAESIRAHDAFYLPWGEGEVSLVDVRDIGEVAAAALTGEGHGGQIYEITGSEALSGKDCADILSLAVERKISYVDTPESQIRLAMEGMGTPPWFTEVIMELYAANKAGYTAAVTDAIHRVTGRTPRTFTDYAADYAGVFQT